MPSPSITLTIGGGSNYKFHVSKFHLVGPLFTSITYSRRLLGEIETNKCMCKCMNIQHGGIKTVCTHRSCISNIFIKGSKYNHYINIEIINTNILTEEI